MKKLILHADDFGLTEGINRGILTAFKQGVVSSASLLVNFSQSLPALRVGRAEGLDLGDGFKHEARYTDLMQSERNAQAANACTSDQYWRNGH